LAEFSHALTDTPDALNDLPEIPIEQLHNGLQDESLASIISDEQGDAPNAANLDEEASEHREL
jgi:hypothetical protein